MGKVPLPKEVQKDIGAYELQQQYNPDDVEQVEGNLRMTKIRRTIPITSHYFSTNNEREQPHR